MRAWSPNISIIFIVNSKINLVFETEMLNGTANEESLRRVRRFFIYSRFVVSEVKFVHAKFLRPFSTSSAMIPLAFLSFSFEKSKAILYHSYISKRYFLVCHLKIVFNNLHELMQRSSDVTGRH